MARKSIGAYAHNVQGARALTASSRSSAERPTLGSGRTDGRSRIVAHIIFCPRGTRTLANRDKLQSLDELYVISDLHLGGIDGRRIFAAEEQLALWIDGIAAPDRDLVKKIALVINGDIVDFLAAEGAKAFDAPSALAKLDAVLEHYKAIFDALGRFAAVEGNLLYLAVGNHDVELGLTSVRQHLIQAIYPRATEEQARRISFDGEPLCFLVGDREIHCVHGNAYDDWNRVDHSRVAEIDEALQRHELPAPWVPNAGSKLVVEVMNDVKKTWPFIDLLKPEGVHFVPLLAMLDPEKLALLATIFPIGGSYLYSYLHARGLLGDEAPPGATTEAELARRLAFSKPTLGTAEQMLEDAEISFRAAVNPKELAGPVGEQQMLGPFWDAFRGWVAGKPTRARVRDVLRGLMAEDRTFDLHAEDDVFRRVDAEIHEDVDFVIAGHTHLERALRRRKGTGYYFNSGTWIRLLELDQYRLASDDAFKDLYAALSAGSIDALDPFDLKRRTVVKIAKVGKSGAVGELFHVGDDGVAVAVPGSRMPRASGLRKETAR